MSVSKYIKKYLNNFPECDFAFAYGSGVFQQMNHPNPLKNMLDMVIMVQNPYTWHQENIKRNPSHYSFLKWLGPGYINRIQEKYGAQIYFNTMVEIEGRLVKYGVVSKKALITDLLDWCHLYLSGRLHKPVEIINMKEEKTIKDALMTNKLSAIHTSLLLLPQNFSEEDLFKTIASLSYNGDFRMIIGEDKNKVSNIVRANIERFRKWYEDPLELCKEHVYWDKTKGLMEQSCSPTSINHHLNLLPKCLMFGIATSGNPDSRHRDTEEVLRILSNDPVACPKVISKELSHIVWRSSLTQSLKGICTAGFFKSLSYVSSKIKKYYQSLN